ncbi:MAG: Ldh family oxidoreductase [Gemmatimonadetes bacterium]|nr:Ldh family oxidoreductase [Gemmatimonadota bacterium]MYD25683.1 Ldh family oxidoreductase [Gemmatimonadota bacterium]
MDLKLIPEACMAIIPVDYTNPRYGAKALRRFAQEALRKAGLSEAHAKEMADYLTATDLRGVLSHGTRQLPGYVRSFQSGRCNPRPNIRIYREAGAVVQWDGDGGMGHLVSARAIRSAVSRARSAGICLVTATHCGHTGSVGNWTRIATGAGMICLYYSTPMSPLPFDRPQPVAQALNNPPVSFGFPSAEGEPPVLIDMGTHLELPDVMQKVAEISVLPLIKGLAYQVTSVMMTWPVDVQSPVERRFPGATSSLTAVVLDTAFIGDPSDYTRTVADLRQKVHAMQPLPGLDRALLPGEIEAEREVDFSERGIPLDDAHIQSLQELGDDLGVPYYWESCE